MMNFVCYDNDGTITSAGFMVSEAIALSVERGEQILEIEPRENFDWRGFRVDLHTMQLVEGAPPPEPEPAYVDTRAQIEPISDKQFYTKAAFEGIITKEDALKAVQTGFIPAPMQSFIDTIQDPEIRFAATMLFAGETTIYRQHPLIEGFLLEQGKDAGAMDRFFAEARAY